MSEKLSDIQGMKIPHWAEAEIRKKLSNADLLEYINGVYGDEVMSDELPKYFLDWLDGYHKGFVDRRGMDEHRFELYMIFSVVQIAQGDSDDPEHDQITRVGRFIIANPEKCIKEVMRRYEVLNKAEE